MFAIEYVAFAHYPSKSETFHDGGLVGLFLFEAHKSFVFFLGLLVIFLKEMLLRRLRSPRMCCTCGCLYSHVDVQSDLCLTLSSVTCPYLEQSAQMKKWPQIRLLIIWIGGLKKYGHLCALIAHGSWDLYRTDLFCAHIIF